jgi:hypothetical protein
MTLSIDDAAVGKLDLVRHDGGDARGGVKLDANLPRSSVAAFEMRGGNAGKIRSAASMRCSVISRSGSMRFS